jgi:hypothetical protein
MFLWLKKAMDEEKESALGKLFQGAGLTGGAVGVYEFFEFVKANPTPSLSLLKEFGPIFVIAVILILLVNRLIGVMEKSATSSQEMADAVRAIADKDDRQAERLELMTQYNSQRAQEAADSMGKLHDEIRLQNSALDRIEKRQAGMESKLDMLHPAHDVPAAPERKGLPT